ncbi:thioesterase domain-containing protein, putative [Dyella jiangningensis]|uniref:YiiD C-terminal domain-containing protein n=1 Tax=Dyella sp. AtDHG13 TaxID=1938897 RepID=UPI00088923C7|nr:YiiD C-terminal domain-containing protein [Dyella sp. AtDHG13]PXV59172.1 thioesterase domain-containing protein [Dyella sp. AtDHG13]SDK24783.1 thioesterase domain-containing protein, putative [Dyella jiangningensis]
MSTTERHTLARKLVTFMRDEIPLAQTMDLNLHDCDETQLTLAAPLGPNVNDKGCAFGGSLVSVMTLNGWSLVELELRMRGLECDVFVGESTVRYLEPVWDNFLSEARLAEGADWDTFFSTLAARGRARIDVSCRVPGTGEKPAATLEGRFVAKRRSPDAV